MTNSDTTPHTILDALAHGVTGKTDEGLALIQPIIDAGPRSTFALLCCLAESIAGPARDAHGPGTTYVFTVEDDTTGASRSSGDLPSSLRFASQFITAWANGDEYTAWALFWSVASWADTMGTGDLADAIRAVYDLAVVSCRKVIIARRGERATGAGQ